MTEKSISLSAFSAGVTAAGLDDVSILSANQEVLGHGFWSDEKTLAGLAALLNGRTLKAYLTHNNFQGDRIGQEVGVWQNFRVVGEKLKASLVFFTSFIKHQAETYEKLLELAAKVPDQFGVSIVGDVTGVWVTKSGREIEADGPRPPDALRELPSLRVKDVSSADLVSEPAVNRDGLFSEVKATGTIKFSEHLAELAAAQGGRVELAVVNAKFAALQAEHAELRAKYQEALAFDCRLSGVPHDAARIFRPNSSVEEILPAPEAGAGDAGWWQRFSALAEKHGKAAADRWAKMNPKPKAK